MSWGRSSWSSGRRGHCSGDCFGSAGLEKGRGEAGRRLRHREHGKRSPAQSCRHGPICRSRAVTTTSCLLWAAQLITRHEERRVRRIFWREKQSFHRALWFTQERWMFRGIDATATRYVQVTTQDFPWAGRWRMGVLRHVFMISSWHTMQTGTDHSPAIANNYLVNNFCSAGCYATGYL